MEGTVSDAKREEGRPAFAGTGAGVVATEAAAFAGVGEADKPIFSLELALAATGLAGATLGADFAEAATTAAGFCTDLLESLATAFAGAGLAGFLATGLEADFTTGLAATLFAALTTGLATGLVALEALDALATSLAAGLTADLGASFVVAFLTNGLGFTLAADFAVGFTAALKAGFATGFPAALGLTATAGALDLVPDFAFTSCLLVALACAWSFAVSLARECTGFPVGKPISCKIETIIIFPGRYI
jgi:hypothetical protein